MTPVSNRSVSGLLCLLHVGLPVQYSNSVVVFCVSGHKETVLAIGSTSRVAVDVTCIHKSSENHQQASDEDSRFLSFRRTPLLPCAMCHVRPGSVAIRGAKLPVPIKDSKGGATRGRKHFNQS